MDNLYKDFENGVFNSQTTPCLSLYQPTHRHHPENQQDPIVFGNLLKQLEESLQRSSARQELQSILHPFLALAEDGEFWNHTRDGLAVLGAPGFFRVYKLMRPVAPLAVVANTFHTKPLLHALQSVDRFHILAVSREAIRLFEGNSDAVEEIQPKKEVPSTITAALGTELTDPHQTVASYGGTGGGQAAMYHGHGGKEAEKDIDRERFFRAVDRAVFEHYSRPSGLPLILAALPEHHHAFHALSHNSFLVAESIAVHPDALSSTGELHKLAWQIMAPRYQERLAALVEEFGHARSKGLADEDLERVAKAVAHGRVASLIVEAGREIPGRIDSASGALQRAELSDPAVDDVLDDLAAQVLQKGGQVFVVEAEQMPTKTGVAATYRY